MADPREVGITNLGDVPDGMSFLEAIRATIPHRKYEINPRHHSRRLTICETQREIWRIADRLPEPARSQLQLLAGAGLDFGKRMDARMKELKGMIDGAS